MRFYLKCGSWWTAVTLGFGDEWAHSADFSRATSFPSRADAERMKERLESRLYAPTYTVVEA